jgi:U3 small nucleolar RNA-associated protein 6
MAVASDKARFYLEKFVPELREYERKKIFSKVRFSLSFVSSCACRLGLINAIRLQEEIASISKKRSDFEHKINARGSLPSDYARYAEYEMNLDALRRKRITRLGVKAAMHTGQQRVLFILARGTRKFYGDIGLWMQYIEYARKQRAHKKLSQILTNALRLHPTQVELWIYAARYALEDHADMMHARSYMQRGLRFCKASRLLWVQYAKLEMIYVSRIAARHKVLGLDESRKIPENDTVDDHDLNADVVRLPQLTGEDVNPTADTDEADRTALETLKNTPALTGAIPIAVFDAAMKQFQNDSQLGYDFFNMVCEFEETPCFRTVLGHIVDTLIATNPTSALAQICYIRYPVAGVSTSSTQFPGAFSTSLSRLKEHSNGDSFPRQLALEVIKWLQPLIGTEDLDPALRKVMQSTLGRAEMATQSHPGPGV